MTVFVSVFRAICLTFEKSIGPVFDPPGSFIFFSKCIRETCALLNSDIFYRIFIYTSNKMFFILMVIYFCVIRFSENCFLKSSYVFL